MNHGFKKFITILGLICGSVAYQILSRLFDRILDKFFRMKALEPLDEMFLYDDEQSLSQISCFIEIEKFDFDKMQHYLHMKI